MNKYQKYIFYGNEEPRGGRFVFNCFPAVWENPEYRGCKNTNFVYGTFDEKNDVYTVFQDEDITLLEYTLWVKRNFLPACIEDIYFYKNDEWQLFQVSKLPSGGEKYYVTIEFNDRIQKIKFTFKNNLADDYIIEIKYVEGDKQAYYERMEEQRKTNLLNAASIKCSTGNDLVNIYFQPCSPDCVQTEITLYCEEQMIAKYNVEGETFFQSIGGLAYGKYEFVLRQFDRNENIILETDKISFCLSSSNSKRRKKPVVII